MRAQSIPYHLMSHISIIKYSISILYLLLQCSINCEPTLKISWPYYIAIKRLRVKKLQKSSQFCGPHALFCRPSHILYIPYCFCGRWHGYTAWFVIDIVKCYQWYIYIYTPLWHLRSKETTGLYITYSPDHRAISSFALTTGRCQLISPCG